MTQMSLSMKQKQIPRHREQICGCRAGGRIGEGQTGRSGLAHAKYYT